MINKDKNSFFVDLIGNFDVNILHNSTIMYLYIISILLLQSECSIVKQNKKNIK